MNILDRFFRIRERGSTIKTELLAGLTIFFAISYILFIAPALMSQGTGAPLEAMVATYAIVCGLSSIIMGVFADLPISLGPSFGIIAFVSFTMTHAGIPWQTSIGAVFISGLIMFILTATKFRQKLINVIPEDLKSAVVVGIGLFLAFIGLKSCGIVVANDANFVQLGNIRTPGVALAMLGIVLTCFLELKRFKGSFIISIISITLLGMAVGITEIPSSLKDIMTLTPANPADTFLKLDIPGVFRSGIYSAVLSITFISLFESTGTLVGVAGIFSKVRKDSLAKDINKALYVDTLCTMGGSIFGGTVMLPFIESSVGVTKGAKTGLAAVVAGLLFLAALWFAPLLALVPPQATGPILLIIGLFMAQEVVNINFSDFETGFPAFSTILLTPLTFSIANGVAYGIIFYVVLKIFAGKYKEIHPLMYTIGALFLLNLIFGTV